MVQKKRRNNREGSIRHRNNSWQIAVMDGYRPDGKRKIRYFTGKTLAEAKKKLRDFERDREDGLCLGREYTVGEWGPIFLENHKHSIRPVTYESYKYTLRHIVRVLGDKKLNEVMPIHVDQFLQGLREEGFSDATISQARGLLFMLFQGAISNCIAKQRNPVAFAQKMRKRPAAEKDVYTVEEVRRLFNELPNDRIGNSVRLMLGTGLRTQELLALRPKHILEDGSAVIVEQAVSMVRGTVVVSTPKSYDSYRTVPIPAEIRPYAVALRQTDADYIWSVARNDMPCSPSTFRSAYSRTIQKVGIRYISAHGLRHTYVTTLQSMGVPIETIQALVGHSTALMTKHYLHVQDPVRQEAVAKLSAVFSSEEN